MSAYTIRGGAGRAEPGLLRGKRMASECIDLRQLSGGRFRPWNETLGRRARDEEDPWDVILPGWSGFIAP